MKTKPAETFEAFCETRGHAAETLTAPLREALQKLFQEGRYLAAANPAAAGPDGDPRRD